MSDASHIQHISGRAIPVRGQDIDTDRIIPARFLKSVTFDGLEAHAFEDDRRGLQQRGSVHPFDNPSYAGASILLANANFGCGSSREHAPQALRRWGIKAIVAESFAEIFFGNSMSIGLPCVTASHADVDRLIGMVEKDPAQVLEVDLKTKLVTSCGSSIPVDLPASARDALMSGDWDATGLLLANYGEVERAAAQLPYIRGF